MGATPASTQTEIVEFLAHAPAANDEPCTDETEAMKIARRAIAMAALTNEQKTMRLADLRRDPAIARFWALAWPEAAKPPQKATP